jgi:hypothetical protein
MKNGLTVTLTLVALTALFNPAFAQQKETPKSPPAGAATTQPSAAAKNSGHATEQLMTGKVITVDPKAKSFTVISKGKQFTFSAAELKAPLPEVGKIIDIKYHQTTPGGPLKSIALNSSRSNVY